MKAEQIPSRSDPSGSIVRLEAIERGAGNEPG
jgi:hypothetical protein